MFACSVIGKGVIKIEQTILGFCEQNFGPFLAHQRSAKKAMAGQVFHKVFMPVGNVAVMKAGNGCVRVLVVLKHSLMRRLPIGLPAASSNAQSAE